MHILLEQLQQEIAASVSDLNEQQTQLRTAGDPARWTIQQIIDHLMLTYSSSCGVVEERVEKGTPTKAVPSPQQRIGQWVVLSAGRFPKGREAPAMVMPPESGEALSGERLAARTKELLTRFDGSVTEAERLFGDRRAISHAVLGPLSAMQWRRFHLIHGQHHLKQIRAIRRANGM